MSAEALVRLDPIETAIDDPIGQDETAPSLPMIDRGMTALTAVEQAMLGALQRPPCLVAFSGGLDSSTLLAVAARVARREGLALPVPATMRFPGVRDADESAWQEAVLREVKLPDWHRRDLTEELDLLGPAAQSALRRHGLMSPSQSFTWSPFLADASPGTLVTGLDGDGLFGSWRLTRLVSLLHRQATLERRDVRGLLRELAPIPLRRAWFRLRTRCTAGWVRPGPAAEIAYRTARAAAEEPLRWSRRVAWLARNRFRIALRQASEVLAAEAGTRLVHAFLEPRVLAAIAREGANTGFGDRNSTMSALFGAAIPRAVVSRRDKPEFSGVYWGPRSREFAETWNGGGLPGDLIDHASLRREWLKPLPDARSQLLLQAAWLAENVENPPAPMNCCLT